MAWLRFVAYFVAVVIITAALTQLEVWYPGSLRFEYSPEETVTRGTSEFSLVEILQAGILVVSGLLMAYIARHSRTFRPLAIAIGGVALAGLIRELDYFFDRYLFDNVWQAVMAVAAALLLTYLYRHQKRLQVALARAWPSPGIALLLASLTLLLGFSLLVGHEPLWQAIMGEHYVRVAKLAIEEMIELSGYYIWMAGSIEFAFEVKSYEQGRHSAQD